MSMAEVEPEGWRPIEDNPPEIGTFLAYNPVVGVYQTVPVMQPDGHIEYLMPIWAGKVGSWYPKPTHWKPLPAPPKDEPR